MPNTITYRWLEGDALNRLEPTMSARGWTSLNNRTARALCAFDGDELIGFHVLQLFPHCEPLFLDAAYRGQGIAEALSDGMIEFMVSVKARGFMVVADNPVAAKLCESHGMRRVSSPVYIMN